MDDNQLSETIAVHLLGYQRDPDSDGWLSPHGSRVGRCELPDLLVAEHALYTIPQALRSRGARLSLAMVPSGFRAAIGRVSATTTDPTRAVCLVVAQWLEQERTGG